jgi:LysR family transcriptional activator of nhaA
MLASMTWLNYHHLYYFWTVAREGTIARACARLHVAQPTISSQLRALEKSLKVQLFERRGRRLVLTEAGQTAFRYAEAIFSTGRELLQTLAGHPADGAMRLVVGAVPTLPKTLVHLLVAPALRLPQPVKVVYLEADTEALLSRLSQHALDVVLTDLPAAALLSVRAYHHLLGECGVSWMGRADLARARRRRFPLSLHGAPVLLPYERSVLRRHLDQWFEQRHITPDIRGEFADSAVMKTFGAAGHGLFPIPRVLEQEIARQFGVQVVGRTDEVRERFYAITLQRQLAHPAVAEITRAAREETFPGL